MRTRRELEIEAARLEQVARQSRENARGAQALAPQATPLVLYSFPETSVRINAASEFQGALMHRMLRRIEFAVVRGENEYRLVEEEFVYDSEGGLVQYYDPIPLLASDQAMDALSAGFQRMDEDRLRESIGPVVECFEANTFPEPVTSAAVRVLEQLTADLSLSLTARFRTKADIVDLLAGRLEAGDFVARAVARQECFSPRQQITRSEQIVETIEPS